MEKGPVKIIIYAFNRACSNVRSTNGYEKDAYNYHPDSASILMLLANSGTQREPG
jgi:hypothetical protein